MQQKAAKVLIQLLQAEHGELIFVQSEGCCDRTAPIFMTKGDFYLGSGDERIGEVEGVPYYMHTSNFTYWQHLQLIINVIDEIGNSFSLESTDNKSFIIRSRQFKE